VPRARYQRSYVILLGEQARGPGAERVARAAAAARGKLEAQAAGRGSLIGPAHAAGGHPKKAVRLSPSHRRELGRWTQAAFVMSERRVSRSLRTWLHLRDRRSCCLCHSKTCPNEPSFICGGGTVVYGSDTRHWNTELKAISKKSKRRSNN
jgi:hypothetical protein